MNGDIQEAIRRHYRLDEPVVFEDVDPNAEPHVRLDTLAEGARFRAPSGSIGTVLHVSASAVRVLIETEPKHVHVTRQNGETRDFTAAARKTITWGGATMIAPLTSSTTPSRLEHT